MWYTLLQKSETKYVLNTGYSTGDCNAQPRPVLMEQSGEDNASVIGIKYCC